MQREGSLSDRVYLYFLVLPLRGTPVVITREACLLCAVNKAANSEVIEHKNLFLKPLETRRKTVFLFLF